METSLANRLWLLTCMGTLVGALPSDARSAETKDCFNVQSSAFNSIPGQTDRTPRITASQHVLVPGDKIVAVSRDLEARGLHPGTTITIEGRDGIYTVADRMPKRWRNKIDLYMGDDEAAARKWGNRKVQVCLVKTR